MELLKDLEIKAKGEANYNEDRITSYLQGLIDSPIRVNVNRNDDRETYLSVEFLDVNGKKYFAADVSISYECEYDFDLRDYPDPVLRMDSSSSGLTSRKENPGKVVRAEFMYKLWQHEIEFTHLLDTLSHSAEKAYTDACSKKQAEERKQAKLTEDAKRNAVLKTLAPGLTFEHEHLRTSYTIQKVTPARVYVNCKHINLSDDCMAIYDCYVNKSLLVDQLVNNRSIFDIATDDFYGKTNCHLEPISGSN